MEAKHALILLLRIASGERYKPGLILEVWA